MRHPTSSGPDSWICPFDITANYLWQLAISIRNNILKLTFRTLKDMFSSDTSYGQTSRNKKVDNFIEFIDIWVFGNKTHWALFEK